MQGKSPINITEFTVVRTKKNQISQLFPFFIFICIVRMPFKYVLLKKCKEYFIMAKAAVKMPNAIFQCCQ